MTRRIAIVGPGRLGTALGKRWADAGLELLGFVGREPAAAARAIEFCQRGRVLALGDCATADAVLVAVGDQALAAVVSAAAPHARAGSVWLHASGFHGLELLAPLAAPGVGVGVLHPLCPIPDPASGVLTLAGAPATIAASGEAQGVLRELAARAGLQPLPLAEGVDRRRYHAACALAANGATALHDAAVELLSAGLAEQDARCAASALMSSAAVLCERVGARDALSGPVLRGDRAVVAAHLRALEDGGTVPVYRALMSRAVTLAVARGTVDELRAAALLELLADG